MNAPVVYEVDLLYITAISREQLSHRPAKQIVADVTQMQWLVGVGRRVFYDHRCSIRIYFFQSDGAVVGDTVGDPFKDTSGPSLNILIKLMSMVSIVMAGLTVAFL